MDPSPYRTDFYEVPRERLAVVWTTTRWRGPKPGAVLASFRQPLARLQSEHRYAAASIGVLSGLDVLDDRDEWYDHLKDLGTRHGALWNIIEPSAQNIASMSRDNIRPERLRADSDRQPG